MSQVTKIEYRAVIKFLTKEGVTPQQIKQRLDGVYGEASPSYSTVKEWAKRFRMGEQSLEDESRSGRPVEVLTPDSVALVEDLVLSDRRLKVKQLSAISNLSETTVRRILHDHLDIRRANGSLCLSIASKTNELLQTENASDPNVMSLIADVTISEQGEHLIKNEYITSDKVNEENNSDQKDNFTFPQKSVDAKPFGCEFCKLRFTRSSLLLRHRRTHTGERPFACKNCDKAFSRQDKLRIHMMRTHEDVFKQKFVCEYCKKVFVRQESLKAHITKHDYEYIPSKYKVPENLHSSIGIDKQSDIQSESQSITESIIQTVTEFTNTSSNSTSVSVKETPISLSNSSSRLLKYKRGRLHTRDISINKNKRRRGRSHKLSVDGEYSNQDNYDLMSLPYGDFSYLTSELPIQLPNSSVHVPKIIETTPTLPVLSPTPVPVVSVDVQEQQQHEEQIHEQPIEDNDPLALPPPPPQSMRANELINFLLV